MAEVVKRLTQRWPPPDKAPYSSAEAKPPDSEKPGTTGEFTALMQRQNNPVEAAWEPGDTVSFNGPAGKSRNDRVALVLGECGYFFPDFKLRVERMPSGGKADLVIEIKDEGPHGTLGSIEVRGLVRHTPAEFLAWLPVKPGHPVVHDLVARVERQLWESARFLSYQVIPAQVFGDPGKVALQIEVVEFTGAPKLGQPFSPEEQIFLKLRDWLALAFHRGEEFIFDVKLTGVPIGAKPISGRFELALSRDALAVALRTKEKLVRGAVVTTNGASYLSAESGRKLAGPFAGALVYSTFALSPNPDPKEGTNSPLNFSFMAGFSSLRSEQGSPVRINLDIAPAAFLGEAHRVGSRIRIENGVVHVTSPTRDLKINARTGALLELHFRQSEKGEGSIEFRIRAGSGAITRLAREIQGAGAALPNLYRTNRPLASVAGALLAEVMASPLPQMVLTNLPTAEQLVPAANAIQRLLLSGLMDPFESVDTAKERDANFFIPLEDEPTTVPDIQRMLWSWLSAITFRFSQEYLPAASWPATLAREGALIFSGHPKYAEPELNRIYESSETGPIGFLAGAMVLAQAGNQRGSAQFAERGLQRLSLVEFQRDSSLLLNIAETLARRSKDSLATFTALGPGNLAALAGLLSPEAQSFFLRGLAALRTKPDEHLRTLLQPLLADYWQAALRRDVEAQLRTVLTNSGVRLEAERLFAQGFSHFDGKDGPTDLPEAARLFRLAAAQGSGPAAYHLGLMHERGTGLDQNFAASLRWYGRAGSNGVVAAQLKLGEIYSSGFDVPADLVTATFWYRLAEMGGDRVAGVLGNSTARRLSAEQQIELMRRLKASVPSTPAGGLMPLPSSRKP